jgi:hypothetical protein
MRKGLLVAALAILALPSGAHAGCITVLPISAKLASSNPRDYGDFATLTVASRGPALRRVKVGLYSFRGRVMAERYVSRIDEERPLRLRIHHRLRTGSYTLYAEGEPNRSRSCGPKHWSRVVTLGTPSERGGSEKSDTESSSGNDGENPDDSIPSSQQL